METYDCEPTLNDQQVLEFCKNGFLVLEGVVPEDVNRRTVEFLDAREKAGVGPSHEPTEILAEDWLDDHVIKNQQAIGAVRSLLGKNVGLPILMSNHRVVCPQPAQNWHRDGGSIYGPELDYMQVFYYPEECPMEMGPTELLPGTHFLYSSQPYMGHYGRIRGSVHTAVPAGSIFLTVYSIWHRRSASTATGLRNNLKYNYWRTEPPRGDWLHDPEFDASRADYNFRGTTFRTQFRDLYDAAGMFLWLRGQHDEFLPKGGQGWPKSIHANYVGEPYGVPSGLRTG